VTILETVARTHYPGIWNVNADKVAWTELPNNPGNWIKVLVIDGANHRVDFLFRQDPHMQFSRHRHRGAVATLTLAGAWGYREGEEKLFEGCFAYEIAGTSHTPYATEEGMTVFASFQGDGPVFLDILDDDGAVTGHVDIDYFRQYYDGE
jgi:hypothetical protein